MGPRFKGLTALVTGAARGIGRASAERLASEGAQVALVDVSANVEEAAAQLRRAGLAAEAWAADVSDEDAVAAAVCEVEARLGTIDVLHSNAGVLLPASAEQESLERWERTFAVNVRGMFLTARAVIPGMRRKRSGAIVLTGSMSGLIAEPAFLAYCTSKAAVNHMARQLALDYAVDGIRVNAVCPGWVDTNFSDDLLAGMTRDEVDAMVREQVPLARQATADEVAAAVAFLASDEAAYITGHLLVMDGGYTLR
jgi:NAD(P)-dependent dehydrogenase (short-subunit alcohol dehydrogenase family)